MVVFLKIQLTRIIQSLYSDDLRRLHFPRVGENRTRKGLELFELKSNGTI